MTGPTPDPPVPSGARYRAFISYSHADKRVADWLHRALETYRIPPKLVGTSTRVGIVPRRLTPIFRDRDELSATHDLGGALTAALEESMFLLVICSPASAKSRWVAEEILAFKRLHGEHRVLAVIAAGEPGHASDECFPPPLRFALGANGELTDEIAHPIAADLREGKDGRQLGKLKLVAGLTGLRLDDVVQREAQRRTRRLVVVASGSAAGMVLAGGLALYANVQRIEADKQRKIAERESAASRAASDFLIGSFKLANPATQNPRTVTALAILSNGAARVRSELSGQPDIESRLLTTLGSAYNNLGLPAETISLLRNSESDIRRAGTLGARAYEPIAMAYIAQGHLDTALATVNAAERQLGDNALNPEITAQLERTRARILFAEGDPKAGLKAVDRALALYAVAPNAPIKSVAMALQTKGLALSDDGQFAAADDALTRSLSMFRKAFGDHDLSTGKAWQALAMNDLEAGHLPLAEERIAKALSIERRVLDQDNPVLAADISIQGQIFQAEHKLDAAAASLTEAIDIYKHAYGQPHYNIGINLVYLALVEAERGHTNLALSELDEAKHNYDVSYGKLHPNHGDLLVNRATILAKVGRRAEATADCAAGIAILDKTLGPDAAFTKTNVKICASLPGATKS